MGGNKIILFNVNKSAANDYADFLGLFYLAAVLEQRGYDPWVFHGESCQVPDILARESGDGNLAAVGFTCDFDNQSVVKNLSRFIKKTYTSLPVIIGGPQAMDLRAGFFERSHCDYVVRGEAEETLPQLLDFILGHQGRRDDIAGITFMDETGQLQQTPDRIPVQELDSLPLPAYHRSLHPGRIYGKTILTGRGCPFSCAFCYQSIHRKQLRLRSMDNVFREIESNLHRNAAPFYLTIFDDTFTLNPERINEFCGRMNELRKTREIVWYCEGHVSLLVRHPEMLRTMAQAGLVRLQIGVESGNQDTLNLYKKQVTTREIERVVSEAVKAGIPQIATNLIIGGPLESKETIATTEAFAAKLLGLAPGVLDIMTGFLRPYPGTAIEKDPEAFGLTVMDPDAERSFGDYPMIVPYSSSLDEVMGFRLHVSKHILAVMKALMTSGKVPLPAIITHYHLARTFHITSMWYSEIYRSDPISAEYFRLISNGAAQRYQDIPAHEALQWRPQRTMELRRFLDISSGIPRLTGVALSPLEFEVLLHSSGKLNLRETLQGLFALFGERFDDFAELETRVMNIFSSFDARYWVVFCPL